MTTPANPPTPTPAPTDIPTGIFTRIKENAVSQDAMNRANAQLETILLARAQLDDLDEGYVDENRLVSLIVNFINGRDGLPEQRVTVEYLRHNQKLVIPGILGMHWNSEAAGYCRHNAILMARYRKLTTQTYAQLKAMVDAANTLAALLLSIDAIEPPVAPEAGWTRFMPWLTPVYYLKQDGTQADDTEIIAVFTYISAACRMNADVRDLGFLNVEGNTKDDDEWMTADKCSPTAITLRLHAYSEQSIAALNLTAVAKNPIAAWTRACGISIGILPSKASKSAIEYMFVTKMPPQIDVGVIDKWQTEYEKKVPELCCNILAMFGLFHLNKDHTHRTGDTSMERIQKSYINAIRTCTRAETLEDLQSRKEDITRTGPHPFGLAQTYWLALAMNAHTKLASPLALRVKTCPPPVQRLMMVNAVMQEWSSIPAGQKLNRAYRVEIKTIADAVEEVRKTPAAYSGLCRLYGIQTQKTLDDAVKAAIDAVIPPIFGYVECTHVNTTNERFGPALALCWTNIKKEHNAILIGWQGMWERYFTGMDTQGMDEFIRESREAMEEARANVRNSAGG